MMKLTFLKSGDQFYISSYEGVIKSLYENCTGCLICIFFFRFVRIDDEELFDEYSLISLPSIIYFRYQKICQFIQYFTIAAIPLEASNDTFKLRGEKVDQPISFQFKI